MQNKFLYYTYLPIFLIIDNLYRACIQKYDGR